MQSPLDLVDAISTRVGAQSLAAAPSAQPAGGVDKKSCDPATATGVAAFATALFGKVCEQRPEEAVTVVSPLSVAAALALALAGATGASAAELTTLLGVPDHAEIARLSEALLVDESVTLKIASSIWLHKTIKDDYILTAQSAHHAVAAPLGTSYAPINAWVAGATEGKIADLLQGAPDPLVRAVLVNAVYFKGSWASKFDPAHTRPGTFHAAGASIPAQFMHRSAKQLPASPSLQTLGGAAAVRLDYGHEDGPFAALLVLPADAEDASMAAAVAGLQGGVKHVLDALTPQPTVNLAVPRFKAEWGAHSLVPALKALGVAHPFNGSGGFLGMSDDPELHISDVVHKALIEVNEEGTVAAAATAVIMKTRSLGPPPLRLTFDRPFLMLVVHTPTGLPMFMGRFNSPDLGGD